MWLYPPWYQQKIEAWKRGEIDWDTGARLRPEDGSSSSDTVQGEKAQARKVSKATVLLRLESLPSILTFLDLLGGPRPSTLPKVHKSKKRTNATHEEHQLTCRRPLEVHGMRLEELTQRTSAVMQVTEMDGMQERDPTLNVFRTFGIFHNLAVSTSLSITPEEDFAEVLTSSVKHHHSDMLLVPWSETGTLAEISDPHATGSENRFTSQQYNSFISRVLDSSTCNTAIMVNRGFGSSDLALHRAISQRSMRSRKNADGISLINPISDPSHHVFFPFIGGSDDRLALRFVLQLAENVNVTATIIHVVYSASAGPDPDLDIPSPAVTRHDLPRTLSSSHVPSSVISDENKDHSHHNSREINNPDADDAFFNTMSDSLPRELQDRVVFETATTAQPLQYMVTKARSEVGLSTKTGGDLVVLGRGVGEHRPQIRSTLADVLQLLGAPSGAGAETRKCLGDVAEAYIVANLKASVLVLQAGEGAVDREYDANY